MLVKVSSIQTNGNTIPILDLIQFAHRHNTMNQTFGISFRANPRHIVNGKPYMEAYLETKNPGILSAIQKQWPNAEFQTLNQLKETA